MKQGLIMSCDWGTTSFRLALIDMQSHISICAVSNNKGTVSTFDEWKANAQQHGLTREDFYLGILKQQVDSLSQKFALSLAGVPIVISGMACSSLGIRELPYAPLPFSIDGRDVIFRRIKSKVFANPVLLISGVSNQSDVMRGEETQIIGLSTLYRINPLETTIFIFPGTHSKHIRVERGKITDFKTFMTGELFAVMQQHSILKESIFNAEFNNPLTELDKHAFSLGVLQSAETNLLRTLFSVRINQLFQHLTNKENFFYLSGLLIGTELRSIQQEQGVHIVLCSGKKMSCHYELALSDLGLSPHTLIIPADVVETAAFEGHMKIYNRKIELN